MIWAPRAARRSTETRVTEQTPLKLGDTMTLGGVPLVFLPQTVARAGGAGKEAAGGAARRHVALFFVADGISGLDLPCS